MIGRHRNDEDVSEAETLVRLLEGSGDGLLLVGADGIIETTNRAAADLFGYEHDRLVGRSVDDLVPAEARDRHAEHRRSYSDDPRQRAMGTDLRLFGEHRDGHLFPVEVALSPLRVDGRSLTVVTVRDVTERQEARAQLLLHAERERIAHDLHDLVIQRLFAAGLSLQSVTNLIESPVARDRVHAVTEELDETVRAVRAAIFGLGQPRDTQSLASHLADVVRERSLHLGFTPDVTIVGDLDGLSPNLGDQLVATLTEAMSNIARHADATVAAIRIVRTESDVELTVRDNGRGIVAAPKPLGGLSSVMWRAAELGGTCSVTPVEPSGTELSWQVPI